MGQTIQLYDSILKEYDSFKEVNLSGRYLSEESLLNVIHNLSKTITTKKEGISEEGRPIFSLEIGRGSNKILIWSQMHGNETTTTKAVFDVLNYFSYDLVVTDVILKNCKLLIIPVLNPDGAFAYTRVNSNGIDLNRDATAQTQSESKVLQRVYHEFQPSFCLNMHDQRTIFSAGSSNHPATVSFLSPAYNTQRDINQAREVSMSLIAKANKVLQQFIPNQVGRYDDSFNINCIGDYFQQKGTPTVLFEAGHFAHDYEREQTRRFICIALLEMLTAVANNDIEASTQEYFSIPENEKLFYDLIIRGATAEDKSVDLAVQYTEVLTNKQIQFLPIIEKIGDLSSYYGHREVSANQLLFQLKPSTLLKEGEVLKEFLLNDKVIVV